MNLVKHLRLIYIEQVTIIRFKKNCLCWLKTIIQIFTHQWPESWHVVYKKKWFNNSNYKKVSLYNPYKKKQKEIAWTIQKRWSPKFIDINLRISKIPMIIKSNRSNIISSFSKIKIKSKINVYRNSPFICLCIW